MNMERNYSHQLSIGKLKLTGKDKKKEKL